VQIILSSTSAVPMYEQIKTQIQNAIHGGDVPEGALLPSLRQLAAELRVSVITVTRAYNELVAEGLVTNEHGRGFLVRPLDPARTAAALAARVAEATTELVTAGRSARLSIDDITKKVEQEWKRQ
jgi:GntR family transcriptional regulator